MFRRKPSQGNGNPASAPDAARDLHHHVELAPLLVLGEEIAAYAREHKVPRLVDDAMEKLTGGLTTVKEALSAVSVW